MDEDQMTPEQKKAQSEAKLEQNMAMFGDRFPGLWWRMFCNMRTEGFTDLQSFDLLKVYIASSSCNSGLRISE